MSATVPNTKCPICGSQEILRLKEDLLSCRLCHFADVVSRFQYVAETRIDENRKLLEHYPPEEVIAAGRLVCDYFKRRGHKKWALGGLQARDEEVLNLTVQIDDVRKYAAGFRCELIPSHAVLLLEQYADEQARELRYMDSDRSDSSKEYDLIQANQDRILAILACMRA